MHSITHSSGIFTDIDSQLMNANVWCI